MSLKGRLAKLAIKWTPKSLILWIANSQLKGVARLTDFMLNLDSRQAFVQARLFQEADIIEVLLQDFAIVHDGQSYCVVIGRAESNRAWLSNLLCRVVGRPWKIPELPQLKPHMGLLLELFPASTGT
jgi:hypothetical protein